MKLRSKISQPDRVLTDSDLHACCDATSNAKHMSIEGVQAE